MKDVLDLLISLSLVQSIAFPPVAALDYNLHAFLLKPEDSLKQLAHFDREASDILHVYLTGYASLRKFYDLRDEEVNLKEGGKPSLRSFARKKAATTALLAVISSAADNIHGGLYDPESEAIVQVDGLLTLMGEALPFVNRKQPPSPFLSPSHWIEGIPITNLLTNKIQNGIASSPSRSASSSSKQSKTWKQ